jgi:phenylpropionate dioxygenase-like ring-hydroxylating dioxygenase large terminal subunit
MPKFPPHITNSTLPSDWARSAIDPEAFAAEQSCLAYVWTFLGLSSDVENEGDWIRASIATRSVFVQRMHGKLKGFENRCAHRFYPLRVADKGNGPIVCGFHHWRYDADGRALGIPVCEEAFGVVSRGLDARLTQIEIAVCGTFVFGRYPSPNATETLQDYLGDGFPLIAALSRMDRKPQHFEAPIDANWKFCLHISLDDYHSPAVHPATFGKSGYLSRKYMTYAKFGLHNAFLGTDAPNAFSNLIADCVVGTARATHYIVLQVMPNLVLAHSLIDDAHYYCALIQFVPTTHQRSLQRVWMFPSPFLAKHSRIARLCRPFTDPFRRLVVLYNTRRILREDALVIERLQTGAHTFDSAPKIGALEERIAWFEQSYRLLLAALQAKR